ncbi:unnamed protein product [Peniophora sp. CBMAI 1063]|nr:unnamed protein product [Peniophora sp. CBMAI 1063]
MSSESHQPVTLRYGEEFVARHSFRYLVRPARPASIPMPYPGDFVVLCLNPMLSVAHLDDIAKKQASTLRVGKYVALVSKAGQGLPMKTKPTNHYVFKLVRDQARHPERASSVPTDLAIPIAPHRLPNQRDQLCPVADFPHANCVLDTVLGDIHLRVTTTERDGTQVLITPTSEVTRVRSLQTGLLDSYTINAIRSGKSHCLPRHPSASILLHDFPIRPPAPPQRDCPNGNSDVESPNSVEIRDLTNIFAHFLTHPGHLNIPVVDVEYDLNAIDSVADPMEFMRERWALYEIVRMATERMRAAHGLDPIS